MEPQERPLCIDLDGTLIRSDLFAESFFALLRINFLNFFAFVGWLLKGRAHCKRQLADRVDIDSESLPYNEELIQFLREERASGRKLVLATASDAKYAQAVARHLGLFDDVLASDGQVNLKRHRKAAALVRAYGEKGFDYAGDSRADLPVWSKAAKSIAVNVSPAVVENLRQVTEVERVFNSPTGGLKDYIRAIRLTQWLKNLLVFVPLMMAHLVGELSMVINALIAFVAFGFCASSVYLLNDLLDIAQDRKHPSKRKRPLAAGTISIQSAVALIPVLLLLGLGLALLLPLAFLGILGIYYVLTLGYSLRLKRVAFLDVLVLALLYTLRIVAGAAAVSEIPSFWLLAFSTFLFLSLALVKRYTEFQTVQSSDGLDGRSYHAADKETIAQFGASSGLISVLVLALYINSDTVTIMYSNPQFLWGMCPPLMYIVGRVWLLARRGVMHDDPLVFAIRDLRSQGCVAFAALALLAAI